MRIRMTLVVALTAAVLAVIAAQVCAQQKQDDAKPDMQEMMKKWAEAATPGAPHKVLEHFIGTWDAHMRMWMEGPTGKPTETKATAVVQWIMDGRFIQEQVTSRIMDMPHKGMGITGYDNVKKKYISFWVDNLGTSMVTTIGDADPSGKTLTFHGKMDEPATGERDKPTRFVTRIISKDTHVFEIYDLAGTPNEFKAVEVTYTRKQ